MTDLGSINTRTDINPLAGAQLDTFVGNDAIFLEDPARFISRVGNACVAFGDGVTEEQVVYEGVIPNHYVPGGPVIVDIDWAAETAVIGEVVWGVQFEKTLAGSESLDVKTFATRKESSADTTDSTNGLTTRTSIAFTQAEADSIIPGSSYRIQLSRVTGNVLDTMVGDAHVVRVAVRQ